MSKLDDVRRRLVRTARYAADQLCEIADAAEADTPLLGISIPGKEVGEVALFVGALSTPDTTIYFGDLMITDYAREHKIMAIKVVRSVFGHGLKEAKDIIDKVQEGAPVSAGSFGLAELFEKVREIRAAGYVTAMVSPA